MLLLWTLLAIAAPYRPPAVPVPGVAGVGPSPYEGQLTVPAVDVETRVVLKSTIAIDVSGLAAAAAQSAAVQAQLAADPRWRVVEWEGARVANQRAPAGKEWTVPLRGYHVAADGVWRTAVVLSPWNPDSVWVTSPLVGRAASGMSTLGFSLINYEGNPDWRAVAWEWGDPGAVLEVFEAGPRASVEALAHTNDALSAVPYQLGRIAGVGMCQQQCDSWGKSLE